MANAHSFNATTIDGHEKSLVDYAGNMLLIVNVASKCGFTPQYEGLETLYEDLHDKGLEILGFPCNQFEQELDSEAEIADFCSTTYHITFPLFARVDVNGPTATPLYTYLREAAPGEFEPRPPTPEGLYRHVKATYPELIGTDAVKWNFTKFLVGRDGEVIKRYETAVTPAEIAVELEPMLVAS